jgi:purine nucleosidase
VPRKVILDCDPGHDDAMAILLARGNPEIELVGITTVAGNHTIDKVTLNARRVCTVAGIDNVPIAQGCGHPLTRKLVVAPEVHGDSGLDGPAWGEPTVGLVDGHAVDLIIELVMASPGEISLVPVGPLTNIALALRKEPRIAENAREVVLMGGSTLRGNKTPAGESNIYVDPEAAVAVFDAPWPVTMVGLNLTHQARATPEVLARISAVGTPVATMVVELMEFFRSRYLVRSGFESPPVHDACCIARLIRPEVVECVETFVAVETASELTRGMTLVDFDNRFERPPNALVATKLDFEGFWDLMVDAIQRIG